MGGRSSRRDGRLVSDEIEAQTEEANRRDQRGTYRWRGGDALCCSCLRFSRASFLFFLSFRQRRFESEPRPIARP